MLYMDVWCMWKLFENDFGFWAEDSPQCETAFVGTLTVYVCTLVYYLFKLPYCLTVLYSFSLPRPLASCAVHPSGNDVVVRSFVCLILITCLACCRRLDDA